MRQAVTAEGLDTATVQAMLARTGSALAHDGAQLVARLDPPRIIWANQSAETLFGTQDFEALTARIFGRDASARAMTRRLGRLAPGAPHLERVVVATRFRRAGVTLACTAVFDSGSKAIVFRTPGEAASRLEGGPFDAAALQHLPDYGIEGFEPLEAPDAGKRAGDDASERSQPRSHESGEEPRAESGGRAPSRFLWATDHRGAFVRIDPGLGAVLGRNAPKVGENLPARLRALGADAAAQALDERRSWSGVSISWPLDEAEAPRHVVLAGAPSPGSEGGFHGFMVLSSSKAVPSSKAEAVVEDRPLDQHVEAEEVPAAIGAALEPAFDQADGASKRAAPRAHDDEDAASARSESPVDGAVEPVADRAAPATEGELPEPDAERPIENSPETAEPTEVETPAIVARSRVIPLPPVHTATPSKVVHLASFKTGIASFSGQATVKVVEPSRTTSAETGESLDTPQWAEAPDTPATIDSDERDQRLSSNERLNFDAIRRTLAALPVAQRSMGHGADEVEASLEKIPPASGFQGFPMPSATASAPIRADDAWALLECLAIGILVVQAERPVYANRATLDLLGYGSVEDLAWTGIFGAGGVPRMTGVGPQTMTMTSRKGEVVAVDARMQKVVWEDGPATLISVRRSGDEEARARVAALGLDLRKSQVLASDLAEALDIAASGAGFLDARGRILSVNLGAERLFGFDQREIVGESCSTLIAPDQQAGWSSFFEGFATSPESNRSSAFRRFEGRRRDGAIIRLSISLRRIDAAKICVVWQENVPGQGAESEIDTLRRDAERSSALKSDFLAKVSHEIRTPLNAILGFTEIIIDERFGAIGNDRYRDYLKDIHASGTHVLSLINDLLDLSRIEAGGLDLNLIPVNANVVVGECVATLQGQAHRDRIIIRTSLAARSPLALADERTFRQIVLNLLSNAVKFNEPGGQVIVSTAVTEAGFVVVRVRDTGLGMSEDEIQTAMMPYRQIATLKAKAGSGLGLPLTKAMIEASRGSLRIQSKPGEGTLVEVTFQHAPEAAVSEPGLSDSTAG